MWCGITESLERDKLLLHLDKGALVDVNFLDGAVSVSLDVELELHRLNLSNGVSVLDLLAHLD